MHGDRSRLPRQTLRATTAGRGAWSARRLAASITGSRRKVKTAGYSIARCVGLPTERIEIAFGIGAIPIQIP
jgi:hypothetical protein